MSDIESDDDFKKFGMDMDDDVRPIELEPGEEQTASVPDPAALPPMPEPLPPESAALNEAESEAPPQMPQEGSEEARAGIFDDSLNYLEKGDYRDIREKDPSINRLIIGAGWEQRSMEDKKVDLDLSCFLLNRDDMTRENEDFIFYNNETALDGAVKHQGDNRTGAGEGDDEQIFIDLNGVPFDVLKVMLVLSVYDEERKGLTFGYVRDLYIRIVNQDDEQELYRFVAPEEEVRGANAYRALCLVREGPNWFVEAQGKTSRGRLNEVAADYGLVIKEDTG